MDLGNKVNSFCAKEQKAYEEAKTDYEEFEKHVSSELATKKTNVQQKENEYLTALQNKEASAKADLTAIQKELSMATPTNTPTATN